MAIKGSGASFSLGTNVVAGLTSISNPVSADSLDVTVFNATAMRDFIAGLRSGTIDVSGYYESGDTTGQVAMMTAMLAGTKLTSTQKPKILWDGTKGFTGDGIITSLTIDAAVDGIVNWSASIQLTGTIAVV